MKQLTILLASTIWLLCACQPQPTISRKPGCDGEQCRKQVTPESVLQKKPLVYY